MSVPSSPSTPSPSVHPVPSSPHRHLHPPSPSSSPSPLSRPASRHSRRPRPVPPPPSTLSLSHPSSVSSFLHRTGHSRHIPLFARANLPLSAVLCLSNNELRDDVGITVLSHRRSLLRSFALERIRLSAHLPPTAPSVPEFGRILVHLSNVRTFHSWLRTGTQAAIFALALLTLAPSLRGAFLVRAVAAAFVVCAVAAHVYGIARYFHVQKTVENNHGFSPDAYGVVGILLIELGVAAVVSYILLVDGFVPDAPG